MAASKRKGSSYLSSISGSRREGVCPTERQLNVQSIKTKNCNLRRRTLTVESPLYEQKSILLIKAKKSVIGTFNKISRNFGHVDRGPNGSESAMDLELVVIDENSKANKCNAYRTYNCQNTHSITLAALYGTIPQDEMKKQERGSKKENQLWVKMKWLRKDCFRTI